MVVQLQNLLRISTKVGSKRYFQKVKIKLQSQRKSTNLPKLTKAAQLNSDYAHKKLEKMADQKPLFKMKKFQNLTPKVDNVNYKYIRESNWYKNY